MTQNKKTDPAISKTHDIFFKRAMSDKRVSKEFFESHLPAEIKKQLNLDQLELQSGSFIDDMRQESIADMLFKTKISEDAAYLYLLVDHQSTPDELMPFRVLKYICNIINQHFKETEKKRIPFIFPMVIYHGKNPWVYSRDIQDLIDAPREWIENYFLKPFILIDLNQIEDEVIQQKTWSGVMELTLKRIFERDFLPFLEGILTLLQRIEHDQGGQLVEDVLVYIFDRGELDKKDFVSMVKVALSEEKGEKVMTVAEQFRAEGKAEGRKESKTAIAKRLLSEGVDITFVSKITELSLEEIHALAEMIH